MSRKHLGLTTRISPYWAALDHPEDHHGELVQEASVRLGTKKKTVARLDALIIRCDRVHEVDVLDMAGSHSGYAEEVVAHLQDVDEDEFCEKLDGVSFQSVVLLICGADLGKMSTKEVRHFIRRALDQFHVDLVFIQKDNEDLARHFRGFFEETGPFLAFSKALIWPKTSPDDPVEPPPPSPSSPPKLILITSKGGQA